MNKNPEKVHTEPGLKYIPHIYWLQLYMNIVIPETCHKGHFKKAKLMTKVFT